MTAFFLYHVFQIFCQCTGALYANILPSIKCDRTLLNNTIWNRVPLKYDISQWFFHYGLYNYKYVFVFSLFPYTPIFCQSAGALYANILPSIKCDSTLSYKTIENYVSLFLYLVWKIWFLLLFFRARWPEARACWKAHISSICIAPNGRLPATFWRA